MPITMGFPDFEDIEEEAYVKGLPASLAFTFDPERWDEIEWARQTGFTAAFDRANEGAVFRYMADNCTILGMRGGQFLHSDRECALICPERGGHLWNAVIDADGEQMLLVKETETSYRHHHLAVGALIYINIYQPHLVSRSDPRDTSVIIQVGGIGPDEPERALAVMRAAVARRAILK